jgi:hypothetical protein
LSNSSLLRVQASPKKLERMEGNMPTKPLDVINCTPEEFFHQMVITKNIFKDTVVSDLRGYEHCITTLTKLSAGNTVIQQDFKQWTSKERQDFISSLSTLALCYDQVHWVNVGIDPNIWRTAMVTNIRHHTAERHSNLWTQKWPGITLRNLRIFRIIYSVKSIKG